jgi:hypothetical protein
VAPGARMCVWLGAPAVIVVAGLRPVWTGMSFSFVGRGDDDARISAAAASAQARLVAADPQRS